MPTPGHDPCLHLYFPVPFFKAPNGFPPGIFAFAHSSAWNVHPLALPCLFLILWFLLKCCFLWEAFPSSWRSRSPGYLLSHYHVDYVQWLFLFIIKLSLFPPLICKFPEDKHLFCLSLYIALQCTYVYTYIRSFS